MERCIREINVLIPGLYGLRLHQINGGDRDDQVIPSPFKTLLPKLSEDGIGIAQLPYPPDAYPGPRNVESPYGSLRVYEGDPKMGGKYCWYMGSRTRVLHGEPLRMVWLTRAVE